jgi:hypothetical protein
MSVLTALIRIKLHLFFGIIALQAQQCGMTMSFVHPGFIISR